MQRRPIPFLHIYLLVIRSRWRMYVTVFSILTVMAAVAHNLSGRILATTRQTAFPSFWLATMFFFWFADITVWYSVWRRATSSRRRDDLS